MLTTERQSCNFQIFAISTVFFSDIRCWHFSVNNLLINHSNLRTVAGIGKTSTGSLYFFAEIMHFGLDFSRKSKYQ